MPHVLVVGASLGGLRAAEALRSFGFDGSITVVGAERHMPYNRPPLSKEILLDDAEPALDDLLFQPRCDNVVWQLGMAVLSADLDRHEARLADGTVIGFDALIAATGLRPRSLPLAGAAADRFTLRSFEEARALRRRLVPGARVAVIGGGFVGCELASSAQRRGCTVTVIEPLAAPMQRALGVELGEALMALHERAGIKFRTGHHVTALETDAEDRLLAVILDDGARVAADLLVEAVGSLPNTDWLADNTLDLSDGIRCDGRMAMLGRDNVAAAGDLACFPNALFDDVPRRVEHWSMVGLTARRAGEHIARLLGAAVHAKPFAPLPTFWSDQLGLRIQSAGMPHLADRIERIEGGLDPARLRNGGVALGYWRGDRQVGVVAVGLPPQRFIPLQADLVKAMQLVSV